MHPIVHNRLIKEDFNVNPLYSKATPLCSDVLKIIFTFLKTIDSIGLSFVNRDCFLISRQIFPVRVRNRLASNVCKLRSFISTGSQVYLVNKLDKRCKEFNHSWNKNWIKLIKCRSENILISLNYSVNLSKLIKKYKIDLGNFVDPLILKNYVPLFNHTLTQMHIIHPKYNEAIFYKLIHEKDYEMALFLANYIHEDHERSFTLEAIYKNKEDESFSFQQQLSPRSVKSLTLIFMRDVFTE